MVNSCACVFTFWGFEQLGHVLLFYSVLICLHFSRPYHLDSQSNCPHLERIIALRPHRCAQVRLWRNYVTNYVTYARMPLTVFPEETYRSHRVPWGNGVH